MYLADIKTRFERTYGGTRVRDALPYAMNSEFAPLLATQMVNLHTILRALLLSFFHLAVVLDILASTVISFFCIAFQKRFSESRDLDAISKVEGQIDELKDIMVKNIGKALFLIFRSIQ